MIASTCPPGTSSVARSELTFCDPDKCASTTREKALQRPRVALLVETSKTFGRGVLQGITRYVRAHRPWSIFVDERGLDDPTPDWLKDWRGDGAITRSTNREVVRAARRKRIAVVHLGEQIETDLPMVYAADPPIARLAAEHLLERRVEHFGFAGIAGKYWSDQRRAAFVEWLAEAGYGCSVFELEGRQAKGIGRQDQDDQLADWLRALPKPCGILACYDVMGLRVLDVCRQIGVEVPEQVAVIGVDNDTLLCNLADPPLSSVAHDLDRIGYEAAVTLDQLMDGRPPETSRCLVDPAGVVARQSTDLRAIQDDHVARAINFIRRHACDGIQVDDIARHVHLSRVTLTRRFEKLIGRSPKAEILRFQIERCRQLLVETDFTQGKIARLIGFRHPEYMNVAFKRETGQTPGEYRQQAKRNALVSNQGEKT